MCAPGQSADSWRYDGTNLKSPATRSFATVVPQRLAVCVWRANLGKLHMLFGLKEIIAARLGENYDLHEWRTNWRLVTARR